MFGIGFSCQTQCKRRMKMIDMYLYHILQNVSRRDIFNKVISISRVHFSKEKLSHHMTLYDVSQTMCMMGNAVVFRQIGETHVDEINTKR